MNEHSRSAMSVSPRAPTGASMHAELLIASRLQRCSCSRPATPCDKACGPACLMRMHGESVGRCCCWGRSVLTPKAHGCPAAAGHLHDRQLLRLRRCQGGQALLAVHAQAHANRVPSPHFLAPYRKACACSAVVPSRHACMGPRSCILLHSKQQHLNAESCSAALHSYLGPWLPLPRSGASAW